jgi:hypothetical protein
MNADGVKTAVDGAKKASTEVKKQDSEVKKSEAVERLEIMLNGSNMKLAKELKASFNASIDEHQKMNNLRFSEILGAIESMNTRLNALESKVSSAPVSGGAVNTNAIEAKLDEFKKTFDFDMNWIKLTLELLNKNDVIGVAPVVKGEVKSTKAKSTKAAAAVVEDVATEQAAEPVAAAIKTANNYFKHVIKEKSFVEKLFADEYVEFVTTNFCTHIKALPLSKEFAALSDTDKISEFLAHVQKNETSNSKLITALNKNAALKEMVSQDFEKWKNDCKLNGNKHFLDEV